LANCKYCGKPAGFLRSKHTECEVRYENGKQRILAEIAPALSSAEVRDSLQARLKDIARQSFVSDDERQGLFLQGWVNAVDYCLEDGVLDEMEEKRLLELQDRLSLSKAELEKTGALSKVVKAAAIRDVLNGVIPKRVTINDPLPINFQKGEQIVWAFPHAQYLEDKTRRQYVGGSQGLSIRVMKGVYYRVGAFKGQAIDRTERVHIDTGWVVITDKNIYFAGPIKSLRLAYGKIVSFQPFGDGVGIIRDAANAKPQIFVTGDGWFTYNLVTNLAQL